METKNSSLNSRIQLLHHQWDLNSQNYGNRFTFNWQKILIMVDIRATCSHDRREKCVSFKFYFNGNYSLFRFIYRNYQMHHDGMIPEITSQNLRLDIIAGPFSFEIFEEEIDKTKKPIISKSIINLAANGERLKKPTTRAVRRKLEDKKREVWFSFDKSSKVTRYAKPFKDEEIWFWVKRTFYKHYSLGILLYEYKLFACCLRPFAMYYGGFKCRRIFDECIATENGICAYISFEITDPKEVMRTLSYKGGDIEDIGGIFGFMQTLQCCKDWEDYDDMKAVYRLSGLTLDEIERQLVNDLSGLGIGRVW